MANANPSRPGKSLDQAGSGMEIAVPKDVKVGINRKGRTVRRTEMSNGNIIETQVFEGDHPDAEPFPKAKPAKKGE